MLSPITGISLSCSYQTEDNRIKEADKFNSHSSVVNTPGNVTQTSEVTWNS